MKSFKQHVMESKSFVDYIAIRNKAYISYDWVRWFTDKVRFKPEINPKYKSVVTGVEEVDGVHAGFVAPDDRPSDYWFIDTSALAHYLEGGAAHNSKILMTPEPHMQQKTYYLDDEGIEHKVQRYKLFKDEIQAKLNEFFIECGLPELDLSDPIDQEYRLR